MTRSSNAASRAARSIPSWTVILALGFPGAQAPACPYDVRDLGFSEARDSRYELQVLVPRTEDLVPVREIASRILSSANIDLDVFDASRADLHPALAEARAAGRLPAAVLVSPDGPSLPLGLLSDGGPLEAGIAAALKPLVMSPAREEILRHLGSAFGILLFVEGPDPEENRRVRAALGAAIDRFGRPASVPPRPPVGPAIVVAIERAAFERERVLLWSLGLAAETIAEPRAAVIYGRARWIGPVMRRDEISEGNLLRIFAIIAADCECGMDLAWTRGTRLPVAWDVPQHAKVVAGLGFDPENPEVTLEMERILRRLASERGPGARKAGESGEGIPSEAGVPQGPTFEKRVLETGGLEKSVFDATVLDKASVPSSASGRAAAADLPIESPRRPPGDAARESSGLSMAPILAGVGLVVIVAIACTILLLRRGSK